MFIFLYGTDTFRSLEKLNAIKNKYLEKNNSGNSLSILDYEDNSPKDLAGLLSAQGLLSTKRLVIIKNILLNTTTEKQRGILDFLKKNLEFEKDTDTVVVFFENGNPKKNLALYKFLATHSKKQEFTPLSGVRLINWALSYSKNISPNSSFSRNALNMLLASTGNDLYALSNEILKLTNYKNNKIIREEDVELLVKSKIDSTMFETIEALLNGDKSQTLKLFHQQLAKGEDVFYILSMYVYQIRTILKIGDFFWQGLTNVSQIAQKTKIHPYVVQKTLPQVWNLTEEKAKELLHELAEIDFASKTGKIDPVLALDTFIVSI